MVWDLKGLETFNALLQSVYMPGLRRSKCPVVLSDAPLRALYIACLFSHYS